MWCEIISYHLCSYSDLLVYNKSPFWSRLMFSPSSSSSSSFELRVSSPSKLFPAIKRLPTSPTDIRLRSGRRADKDVDGDVIQMCGGGGGIGRFWLLPARLDPVCKSCRCLRLELRPVKKK